MVRRARWGRLIAFWLLFTVALVGYALAPYTDSGAVDVMAVLMYVTGVLVLSGAVVTMVLREFRGTARSEWRLRVAALILLIVGALTFFCISYYRLAKYPGEFNELHTAIDALYFTLTTTLTVGYGDVNAAGQIARVEVIIQMLFNVIILAGAVKLISAVLRHQRESTHSKIEAERK